MKTKNNNKGITLLELMIITAIIGITSTLAIPRFGQVIDKLKLKTEARDIISSLRLARSYAVAQRFQFGVHFDLKRGQYVLFKDLDSPSAFTYNMGADSAMVTRILPESVNFGYSSFSNNVVIFKPDGSASSSGAVDLYFSEEEYYASFAVDVLSSTGRVKLIAGSY